MQVTINEKEKTVTMSLGEFYRCFVTEETDVRYIQVNAVDATINNTDLESEVTNLLSQIGMPRNIKGFNFTRQAIILAVENPRVMERVTKELYPDIAKSNGTTASRAERAIRHAIEVALSRGNLDMYNSLFAYSTDSTRGKATNSEFIALLADHIRLQFKKKGEGQ